MGLDMAKMEWAERGRKNLHFALRRTVSWFRGLVLNRNTGTEATQVLITS
jgi:hypothetical protein